MSSENINDNAKNLSAGAVVDAVIEKKKQEIGQELNIEQLKLDTLIKVELEAKKKEEEKENEKSFDGEVAHIKKLEKKEELEQQNEKKKKEEEYEYQKHEENSVNTVKVKEIPAKNDQKQLVLSSALKPNTTPYSNKSRIESYLELIKENESFLTPEQLEKLLEDCNKAKAILDKSNKDADSIKIAEKAIFKAITVAFHPDKHPDEKEKFGDIFQKFIGIRDSNFQNQFVKGSGDNKASNQLVPGDVQQALRILKGPRAEGNFWCNAGSVDWGTIALNGNRERAVEMLAFMHQALRSFDEYIVDFGIKVGVCIQMSIYNLVDTLKAWGGSFTPVPMPVNARRQDEEKDDPVKPPKQPPGGNPESPPSQPFSPASNTERPPSQQSSGDNPERPPQQRSDDTAPTLRMVPPG